MCGIFALLNNGVKFSSDFVKTQFNKGSGRGPEFSTISNVMVMADFGFHRLAINGLNAESNQPIRFDNITLICNGEIYNYKELYKLMDVEPTTDSDCEVIIHLYIKYGIEQTLQMLDGVFSFALLDNRISDLKTKMYVARDPYGVRPLYILKPCVSSNYLLDLKENVVQCPMFALASEVKMLIEFCKSLNNNKNKKTSGLFDKLYNIKYEIQQFIPGTYSVFELPFTRVSSWRMINENIVYHKIGFNTHIVTLPNKSIEDTMTYNIQKQLYNAVEKRCCTTERPIACLLSGGLDSSLITALVMEYHNLHNLPPVETYSIGLAGSEDLKYAQIVADYLGTKHTEILLTESDFLNAIPDVIYAIESYDTTSVRASIGNWLLGKYIASHSEAKVIFNGDGSDELTGGYLYMNCAPDAIEFDKECRRLLKDIYAFDVLRSDKSISSHGLEPRTPFLDRSWVQFYMSIPPYLRFHVESGKMEKYLLRNAFSKNNYLNLKSMPLLPDAIIWRKKEAFSDGVSKQTRSLYEIIRDFANDEYIKIDCPLMFESSICAFDESGNLTDFVDQNHPDMKHLKNHLLPNTAEQFYYRKIFEKHYTGMGKLLPYFWMPKYVNATDASARTLDIYKTSYNESVTTEGESLVDSLVDSSDFEIPPID